MTRKPSWLPRPEVGKPFPAQPGRPLRTVVNPCLKSGKVGLERVDINVTTKTHPKAPLMARPGWTPCRRSATVARDQAEQLSEP